MGGYKMQFFRHYPWMTVILCILVLFLILALVTGNVGISRLGGNIIGVILFFGFLDYSGD